MPLHTVFILYVKNSDTLQTVVQVANGIGEYNVDNHIVVRALVDSGMSGSDFGGWVDSLYLDGAVNYFLSNDKATRVGDYLNNIGNFGGTPNIRLHLQVAERIGGFTLRNYDLNNVTHEGLYVFTG